MGRKQYACLFSLFTFAISEVFGITCTINNTEAVFTLNVSITNSISLTQEQLNGSAKETVLDCVYNGTDWRCATGKTDISYRIMWDTLRVELSQNEGRYTCLSVPPTDSDPPASCKFELKGGTDKNDNDTNPETSLKETTNDGVHPALIIVPLAVLGVVGIIAGIILWRKCRRQPETGPNNSDSGLPGEEQNLFNRNEQQRNN